ncbi:MAG TPA: hypothetical protein VGZ89_09740 [Xanthobacteraceae bacterium]|jgi:hypothetical protein|nr:hypothetical protein [Xanthobacteraceae bacterium]
MFNVSRLGILVGALFASTLPALTQELPEGKGKEAVAATCNNCHPLLARLGSGYTAEGWHTVMRMMVNQGAAIPADQAEMMMQYLIKTFPEKGKPAGVSVPGPVKVVTEGTECLPAKLGRAIDCMRLIAGRAPPGRRRAFRSFAKDARIVRCSVV